METFMEVYNINIRSKKYNKTHTHTHTHIHTQPNHTSINWINNRVDTVEKRVDRIMINQQNWSKLKSTERGKKF